MSNNISIIPLAIGMKDLGNLHYFLGLEVSYIPEGIVLSQKKFTTELLKDSGVSY